MPPFGARREPLVNPVREPDAGKLPVRFDERGVETEHGRRLLRHKRGNPETEVRRNLNHRATPRLYVRREKVLVIQRVQAPPGNWSLQPEAIGATVEVTKPSEPSMERIAFGDSASKQAVTRVNAEQASKRAMRKPTRLNNGEGRSCGAQAFLPRRGKHER
jgi:hypothetical protein